MTWYILKLMAPQVCIPNVHHQYATICFKNKLLSQPATSLNYLREILRNSKHSENAVKFWTWHKCVTEWNKCILEYCFNIFLLFSSSFFGLNCFIFFTNLHIWTNGVMPSQKEPLHPSQWVIGILFIF